MTCQSCGYAGHHVKATQCVDYLKGVTKTAAFIIAAQDDELTALRVRVGVSL